MVDDGVYNYRNRCVNAWTGVELMPSRNNAAALVPLRNKEIFKAARAASPRRVNYV